MRIIEKNYEYFRYCRENQIVNLWETSGKKLKNFGKIANFGEKIEFLKKKFQIFGKIATFRQKITIVTEISIILEKIWKS